MRPDLGEVGPSLSRKLSVSQVLVIIITTPIFRSLPSARLCAQGWTACSHSVLATTQ